MGRIRILPDEVANKIAAGEVVERPASVVKELLENSLDAGATQLRVEVESGGKRLVRVTDDGAGMSLDDAMLAFERHATSKLRSAKELASIDTLGFRGEALPSIASVSRLVLETHSPAESTGTKVEIAGGKMLRSEEAALAAGTVVTVRDLFFNVPARRKFLRSEPTELAHIASLVTHYSLAYPDKAFLLRSGLRELLHTTPVDTLRERVYQVFGSQVLEDLVDLGERRREMPLPPTTRQHPPAPAEPEDSPQGDSPGTLCLRGFISRPQVQKTNRNSIFLFVNGRLIRDRLLLHAISSAYHNLMPPACFPFALLFLECDHGEVDVNVHPSKTEVRFRHGSLIHDFVRDSIRETLVESRPISHFPVPATALPASPGQQGPALPYSEFSQRMERLDGSAMPQPVVPKWAQEGTETFPEFTLKGPPSSAQSQEFGRSSDSAVRGAPVTSAPPESHGELPAEASLEAPQSLSALGDLRPLGQIHESFIIAAGRDGLWIIDQHVAHERILFEKVLKQRSEGKVDTQRLLLPLVLELTASQQVDYDRIADELNEIGFETEPFGNRTISVKSAPAEIDASDIERLVFEILESAERELRNVSIEDLRRSIAASIACQAAIKVNMRLDDAKMNWLLTALASTQCPMSCPHGRPIALRYSTRDILKGFHRI